MPNQVLLSRYRFPAMGRSLMPNSLRFRTQTLSVALAFLSLAFTSPAMAQEEMLRTLMVTGEGVEMIPATKAKVQLGVEIQGETATEVQQQVANRTAAVVELLRQRDVEQLQTSSIRLNPTYDYSDDQRRLTGYTGTNIISFRVDAEQVGALLDEAVQAGATRIDSVNLTASKNAIASAREQALQEATQNALQQADAILSYLNFNREEIVGIQVNGASAPPIPFAEAARLSAPGAAETPVIPGEQEVQASVTLQISY